MSEELLIAQCSPTLAGLKTGNLFTCPINDLKQLSESIRKFNYILVPKGIRIIPVKLMKDRALIYL